MKRLYLVAAAMVVAIHAFSQDSVQPASKPAIKENVKKYGLEIYPNPVKNKLTLRLKGFENGVADVKVVDFKGNPLRKESRLLVSADEEIIMFVFLKPGGYFIVVNQKDKSVKKKFVVL